MDAYIFFETAEEASIDSVLPFLALFGKVDRVGPDAVACDWGPVPPTLGDLADAESRGEIRRSLLSVRKGQLWWRVDDAAFRTGDLMANVSNLLRVCEIAKLAVDAKLATAWSASSTSDVARSSRWATAAFYPVSAEERREAAGHGFLVVSGVAVSLDALARFSIVGEASQGSSLGPTVALLQAAIAGQERLASEAASGARTAVDAAIARLDRRDSSSDEGSLI